MFFFIIIIAIVLGHCFDSEGWEICGNFVQANAIFGF